MTTIEAPPPFHRPQLAPPTPARDADEPPPQNHPSIPFLNSGELANGTVAPAPPSFLVSGGVPPPDPTPLPLPR